MQNKKKLGVSTESKALKGLNNETDFTKFYRLPKKLSDEIISKQPFESFDDLQKRVKGVDLLKRFVIEKYYKGDLQLKNLRMSDDG